MLFAYKRNAFWLLTSSSRSKGILGKLVSIYFNEKEISLNHTGTYKCSILFTLKVEKWGNQPLEAEIEIDIISSTVVNYSDKELLHRNEASHQRKKYDQPFGKILT